MRYVVLTTKHHEGFCLWDSALTDYSVMATPYGKDLIGPFVEAVRAAGLKVGFYHSLLDWHHPDFAIDDFHPLRNRSDAAALNAGKDGSRYRDYLHGQVRELLTRYGTIDYLFFDFSYEDGTIPESSVLPGKGPAFWGSAELLAMVRELQPGIVVNDRLGIRGDFVTPEQYQPSGPMSADGERIIWEACQTLNGSWGYDRDNVDYKSVDLLIRMLVDGVSKDGNMLLNVGPTARGDFDPRAIATLRGVGRVDAAARSVDLRRRSRPISRPLPTPDTRSAATASTCISLPGRSSTSTCPVSRARSTTPSCSTMDRRSASSPCRPERRPVRSTSPASRKAR